MDNTLIINANNKRINILRKQIEKAEEERIRKMNYNDLEEIKKGSHKLLKKFYLIPSSIILFLSTLISKAFFLEGLSFCVLYFFALMPIELLLNHVINTIYNKEVNESLKLDKFIIEKEYEIEKLITYNKQLENNTIKKQTKNLDLIKETNSKEKVYMHIKQKRISHK